MTLQEPCVTQYSPNKNSIVKITLLASKFYHYFIDKYVISTIQ